MEGQGTTLKEYEGVLLLPFYLDYSGTYRFLLYQQAILRIEILKQDESNPVLACLRAFQSHPLSLILKLSADQNQEPKEDSLFFQKHERSANWLVESLTEYPRFEHNQDIALLFPISNQEVLG